MQLLEVLHSLVGGLFGANASSNAASAQAGAANNATAMQGQMFNTVMGNLQPYMGAGTNALNNLTSYLNPSATGGPGGAPGLLHTFGASDLNANLAPNYQFQLGQGMAQLSNQNAATGGAGGGNAFAGEQAYAQNMAGSAYQNAFNNYQTNQNNIYSRLGNLAQLGQASSTGQASGAPLFASGMSNSIIGAGNAQAAGNIGVANALSGGLNNAAGYYTLGNMIQNQGYQNVIANNAANGFSINDLAQAN